MMECVGGRALKRKTIGWGRVSACLRCGDGCWGGELGDEMGHKLDGVRV